MSDGAVGGTLGFRRSPQHPLPPLRLSRSNAGLPSCMGNRYALLYGSLRTVSGYRFVAATIMEALPLHLLSWPHLTDRYLLLLLMSLLLLRCCCATRGNCPVPERLNGIQ